MNKFTVTVVKKSAKIRIVGLKTATDMTKVPASCVALWDAFTPRMAEISASPAAWSYGVSFALPGDPALCPFEYWAAMRLEAGKKCPKGMSEAVIPAGAYARCDIQGLENLGPAYDYFYKHWLAGQKDWQLDMQKPSIEAYAPAFRKSGKISLYFPLLKA